MYYFLYGSENFLRILGFLREASGGFGLFFFCFLFFLFLFCFLLVLLFFVIPPFSNMKKEKEREEDKERAKKVMPYKQRMFMVFLIFVGMAIPYSDRINATTSK